MIYHISYMLTCLYIIAIQAKIHHYHYPDLHFASHRLSTEKLEHIPKSVAYSSSLHSTVCTAQGDTLDLALDYNAGQGISVVRMACTETVYVTSVRLAVAIL